MTTGFKAGLPTWIARDNVSAAKTAGHIYSRRSQKWSALPPSVCSRNRTRSRRAFNVSAYPSFFVERAVDSNRTSGPATRPVPSLINLRSRCMCIIADTFHAPCGHYGNSINAEPCARALGQVGLTKGCWDSRREGVIRQPMKCSSCQYHEARRHENPGYTSFSNISEEGWVPILERRWQNRLRSQASFLGSSQAMYSNFERGRSDARP